MNSVWFSIGTVVFIFAIGVITPGPNFLVTVKNAVTHSRWIGVMTAAGIALATFLHMSAGFLGVTAVIWQHQPLLIGAKIMGGGYLIYSGVRVMMAKPQGVAIVDKTATGQISPKAAFQNGFFTCLSNPKSTLFYLSMFTAVIPQTTPVWARWVMLLLMWLTSTMWYSSVALLFSNTAVQHQYSRAERAINLLVGAIFIWLGVQIILS